jgi:hypothetical protein
LDEVEFVEAVIETGSISESRAVRASDRKSSGLKEWSSWEREDHERILW